MKKTCYNNKYKTGIILFRPFPFAPEGNREKTEKQEKTSCVLLCERDILSMQFEKEDLKMDFTHTKANKSIECTVVSCDNHCATENYCSLDKVRIGTHECNPTMDQCTDCLSFVKK